jgi:tetratricopeptide (TPR) repeat protein
MSPDFDGTRRCDRLAVASAIPAIILFLAAFVQAQSQTSTVVGTVLDVYRHPISGAVVDLEPRDGQPLLSRCDSQGAYHFSALSPGRYTLHVSMAGYIEKVSGPFVVGENETKRINFTLESGTGPAAKAQPAAPEFFDPPQFTVAGVRDTFSSGGHGSDTILRTTEGLVKATVALGESKELSHNSSLNAATEKSLRDAVEHNPEDFDATAKLGEWLLDRQEPQEAVPYLERAFRLNPEDTETDYALALAYARTGEYKQARTRLEDLLADRAEDAGLYELLADVEEKMNDPLAAVGSYQRAAELNPSEANLFTWGSELLLHLAAEPAIEVYSKGHRLYPDSMRMLVGLGAASYSRGLFEQAAEYLCEASDLNPQDPLPYLLLGKIQAVEASPSASLEPRLKRFARLQPNNALANYYYAVSLWKRRSGPQDVQTATEVESLLKKSVELDRTLGPGYLQLGILYAERKDPSRALSAYQKAIAVAPRLEEAHYRLAELYRLTGEEVKAREELRVFEGIKKQNVEEAERDRAEIRQFVYTLRDPNSAAQPQ